MKKYGIYIAYGPGQNLRNQGLGRLLSFIIKSAIENQINIVMAYPKWYEYDIRKLYNDIDINYDKVESITTNDSILSKIINKIRFFKIDKPFEAPEPNRQKQALKIILIPLNLVFKMIEIIILQINKVIKFIMKLIFKGNLNNMKYVLKKNSYIKHILKLIKHYIYDIIRSIELKKLNDKINARDDIATWLIPAIFWPEISDIVKKKVVVVPDIVMYEFPTLFNDVVSNHIVNNAKKVIEKADFFITYSGYVKNVHLKTFFGIDENKIAVIPHGYINLHKYIDENNPANILKKYQEEKLIDNIYLRDFDFKNVSYIIYTSQYRPHKNFMNLLKAYKILLRERFLNIKLITTASFLPGSEVYDFIINNGLHRDVLSFYDVSSTVLAALNAMAICSVNPTLFEGGFPFTFMEAYTVGTPSIMGNIPMTSEFIEDSELREIMLFDPSSVNDMANKIEYGIKNSKKLFDMQKSLHDKFKRRSWNDVASDYIRVLDRVEENAY